MPFFQDIDGLKVLERNSARVEGIELSQARKLIRIYRQAQKELSNQLLQTPDNTFTEARLESTLRQIDIFLQALIQRVEPQLSFGFETLQEQGIEDSAREINRFEKAFNGVTGIVQIDPLLEAIDEDTFLFNQYRSSIETYNINMRQAFQRSLVQSLTQNKTWSQSVFDMEQIFNLNEYKIARIVRTELHQIYNSSKINGFSRIKEDYFPDLKKTLYHPIDSRTGEDSLTAKQKNLIVDMSDPFVYTFRQGNKTIRREFQFPPDRPHDRAILIPYRESYDK